MSKSALSLKNVSKSFSTNNVLNSINFSVPEGTIMGLVGKNGAGKTTMIKILLGLLKQDDGESRVFDDSSWNLSAKTKHRIGYVPQETLLLHDSVFNNITLGDPELGAESAEDALRAAGALEFVEAMPEGMHTIVGERGGKLSGGQRQRIAIARALVHRPLLLILDEATSALDPASEATIGRTLQKLRGELTIIAISHQQTLIQSADRAYCIENGQATLVDPPAQEGAQPAAGDNESAHSISS